MVSIISSILFAVAMVSCAASFQASVDGRPDSVIGFDERALAYISFYNRYIGQNLGDFDASKLRESYRYTPWFSVSLTPTQSLLWARLNQFSSTYEIDKCIDVVKQHIAHYFADLYLHNYASFCYQRDNQLDLAQAHRNIMTNLLYSILASGDGISRRTAYSVINSAEIISFLQLTDIELVDMQIVETGVEAPDDDALQILEEPQANATSPSSEDFDDADQTNAFYFMANVIERANREKRVVWFAIAKH